MAYKVIVADNFHYQDEGAWYTCGIYETAEEAVSICKRIVENSVGQCGGLGMYKGYGENPFVIRIDSSEPGVTFSAWTYAEGLAEAVSVQNLA